MKKRIIIILSLTFFINSVYAQPLVIGRISNSIEKTVSRLQPIGNHIVQNLKGSPFTSASVYVAKNLNELENAVNNGTVHWVTESPYAASQLVFKSKMIPILTRHKEGQKSYGSVLVAKKPIQNISQLLGKRIAAEDPDSFSGYFLIYKTLIERGLPVKFLPGPRQKNYPNHINIIFSQDEENSFKWLQLGLVDAAIFNDLDYADSELFTGNVKSNTNVIFSSKQYPRAVELLSLTLPKEIINSIRQQLIDLGDKENSPILQFYGETTGFTKWNSHYQKQLKEIHRFLKAL